jgi:alkane 1-monooxygenase
MTSRTWDYAKVATFSGFPALPLLGPAGYYLGASWLLPAFVFFGIPLLDWIIGEDPTESLHKLGRKTVAWLRLIPRLYAFVWAGTLSWTLTVLTGDIAGSTAGWLIVSAAASTAFATCVAHELLHWDSAFDRGIARMIMASAAYGQFPIEHLHHHEALGIVAEGTTPPLGQSVWSFIRSNVLFTFRSAWEIERRRVSGFLQNRFVQQWALTVVIAVAFAAYGGAWGLLLWTAQAAFGIFTTEYVNYAQHYGLSRTPDTADRPDLSWNSNDFVTNAFTLNITRHVHHHVRADVPYYELEYIARMPRLPAGYLALFFPVMIPMLWRRIMDGRAQKFAAS